MKALSQDMEKHSENIEIQKERNKIARIKKKTS
jgi:hypothetical protein